jgi:hypothetical protein
MTFRQMGIEGFFNKYSDAKHRNYLKIMDSQFQNDGGIIATPRKRDYMVFAVSCSSKKN